MFGPYSNDVARARPRFPSFDRICTHGNAKISVKSCSRKRLQCSDTVSNRPTTCPDARYSYGCNGANGNVFASSRETHSIRNSNDANSTARPPHRARLPLPRAASRGHPGRRRRDASRARRAPSAVRRTRPARRRRRARLVPVAHDRLTERISTSRAGTSG